MPAHNVTVTVNWKANGSSSGGGSSGGGGGGTSTPGYTVSADKTETAPSPYLPNPHPKATP